MTSTNAYPVLLQVAPQNTTTQVFYYLIEKGQISEEWMDYLDRLYTSNECRLPDKTIDFLLTVIVACVEHFTHPTNYGALTWAQDVRKEQTAGTLTSNYDIAQVTNFEAGCKLMDTWLQPEFKEMWKAKVSTSPIQVKEPVILIYHETD